MPTNFIPTPNIVPELTKWLHSFSHLPLDWIVSTLGEQGFTRDEVSEAIKGYINDTI